MYQEVLQYICTKSICCHNLTSTVHVDVLVLKEPIYAHPVILLCSTSRYVLGKGGDLAHTLHMACFCSYYCSYYYYWKARNLHALFAFKILVGRVSCASKKLHVHIPLSDILYQADASRFAVGKLKSHASYHLYSLK